jgi:hypothetical protein
MVQCLASAMLNKAQLQDIPGLNRRDIENLSIALRRFRELGKTYNSVAFIWHKINILHTN